MIQFVNLRRQPISMLHCRKTGWQVAAVLSLIQSFDTLAHESGGFSLSGGQPRAHLSHEESRTVAPSLASPRTVVFGVLPQVSGLAGAGGAGFGDGAGSGAAAGAGAVAGAGGKTCVGISRKELTSAGTFTC